MDMISVEHREYLLIEKGRIGACLELSSWKLQTGSFKAITHELDGTVGFMNVPGSVKEVEKLKRLCHRAEQGIIAAGAFALSVESDSRPSCMDFARKNGSIEVEQEAREVFAV